MGRVYTGMHEHARIWASSWDSTTSPGSRVRKRIPVLLVARPRIGRKLSKNHAREREIRTALAESCLNRDIVSPRLSCRGPVTSTCPHVGEGGGVMSTVLCTATHHTHTFLRCIHPPCRGRVDYMFRFNLMLVTSIILCGGVFGPIL